MRTRIVLSALASLALLFSPAAAEDKAKDKGLKGTYVKKAGDFDITFSFEKGNVVTFKMTNGTDGCEMTSKYKLENGVYKAEVTKFEKQGNFPAEKEKGYKFTFKAEVKDKKVTISDLEGDDISDEAKQAVQGEYEEKTL